MKKIFTVVLLVLFTQLTFGQSSDVKKMPEFSFVKMQGEGIFTNKDLKKNKKTLIVLFSPECIHCLFAMEHLNNNFDRLKDLNIVLVSEYEKDNVVAFLEKNASKFLNNKAVEILHDTEYEFGPIFQPTSIPTFYLYDAKNELITIKKGSVEVDGLFKVL